MSDATERMWAWATAQSDIDAARATLDDWFTAHKHTDASEPTTRAAVRVLRVRIDAIELRIHAHIAERGFTGSPSALWQYAMDVSELVAEFCDESS